jgi:hypothetical protein
MSVINERFFRCEEGRRQSWYAAETSPPLFRRFAEDNRELLEPPGWAWVHEVEGERGFPDDPDGSR